MPESLENTNISTTYKSLLHTKDAQLPTNGQTSVYDGIGNESSLSIGMSGSGLTVSGEIIADSLTLRGSGLGITEELNDTILNLIYPVGSIYLSIDNILPDNLFPNTEWQRISQGKFIAGAGVGIDVNSNTATISAGDDRVIPHEFSGSYKHTLSANEMPTHTHTIKQDETIFSTVDNSADADGNYLVVASDVSNNTAQGFTGNDETREVLTSEGENEAHNNIPPHFGVYVWKRIN
jgi:hypothetical protein